MSKLREYLKEKEYTEIVAALNYKDPNTLVISRLSLNVTGPTKTYLISEPDGHLEDLLNALKGDITVKSLDAGDYPWSLKVNFNDSISDSNSFNIILDALKINNSIESINLGKYDLEDKELPTLINKLSGKSIKTLKLSDM